MCRTAFAILNGNSAVGTAAILTACFAAGRRRQRPCGRTAHRQRDGDVCRRAGRARYHCRRRHRSGHVASWSSTGRNRNHADGKGQCHVRCYRDLPDQCQWRWNGRQTRGRSGCDPERQLACACGRQFPAHHSLHDPDCHRRSSGTTFSGVNTNLAFLTPTLSYDANNVKLTLVTTVVAQVVAALEAVRAAARICDGADAQSERRRHGARWRPAIQSTGQRSSRSNRERRAAGF